MAVTSKKYNNEDIPKLRKYDKEFQKKIHELYERLKSTPGHENGFYVYVKKSLVDNIVAKEYIDKEDIVGFFDSYTEYHGIKKYPCEKIINIEINDERLKDIEAFFGYFIVSLKN